MGELLKLLKQDGVALALVKDGLKSAARSYDTDSNVVIYIAEDNYKMFIQAQKNDLGCSRFYTYFLTDLS